MDGVNIPSSRGTGGPGRAKAAATAAVTRDAFTVDGTAAEAEAIVKALSGRWNGNCGMCRCPSHDDTHPSLSVSQTPGGRLLLYCFAGCAFGDVLAALVDLGVIERGRDYRPILGSKVVKIMKAANDIAERMRKARATWARGFPVGGTIAEAYLRRRAIRTALPASLRLLPEAWHTESATLLPAMIAAVIREGDDLLSAVHLTYLVAPGDKAQVMPVKRMRGPVKGAAVRLSAGPGPLVVCEGIETGLSLVDALEAHQPAVWAGLSAGGVAALILPAAPDRLVIAPDPDDVGRGAAAVLADRAHAAGWHVRILPPPAADMDWNAAAIRRAV